MSWLDASAIVAQLPMAFKIMMPQDWNESCISGRAKKDYAPLCPSSDRRRGDGGAHG